LLIGALLLGGCVFPPDLGDGSVRCGPGDSCPPSQHCAEGRCYRAGSGPLPDASSRPTNTNSDGGGGSGGNGGGSGGPDLSAVDPGDMSPPVRDFAIGGRPRDMSGCVPITCVSVKATCGYYPDGCGRVLDCYPKMGSSCGPGNSNGTCAGGGVPYTCGKHGGTCTRVTMCKPGECGVIIPNNCDDVVVCPPCP
jgi:hypothetical protein